MKKLIITTLLFFGVFVLSGCDFLGKENYTEIWYDDQMEIIYLSYSLDEPSSDDETTVTEFIYLEAKHRDAEDWYTVIELNQYEADNLEIQYRFEDYGDIDIKIVVKNEAGEELRSTDTFNIYINQPQYIYHLDAYFDEWSGEVNFQFGINQQVVTQARIDKSVDGGLNWDEVLLFDVVLNDDNYFDDNLSYYETVEGNYVFRMVVFDNTGLELSSLNSWGETRVQFGNKVFDGEPNIFYVNSSIDVYSQIVYLWWDASGDFEYSTVEKSTNMIDWEFIAEVPRIGQAYNYQELDDGNYYYRVSAIDSEEVNVSSSITDISLRVKSGAVIGLIDGWFDWENTEINLNWDVNAEGISVIKIERKEFNETEYTLLGEFGSLKTTHNDFIENPGVYTYKIIVYDNDGIELDYMISREFFVEAQNYVHSLNVYYDYDQGYVSFYYGIDQYQVYSIVIEKSSDDGVTWEVVIEKDLDVNNPGYIDDPRYLEFNEGNYTFRLTGYDESDNEVGTVYSWENIMINYDHLNLEEPTEIHYLDGNINVYDQSINLWWSSQGVYEKHLIEKSIDGEVWEVLDYIPRVSTYYYYKEVIDGDYYYRVSAVNSSNEIVSSRVLEYTIRVKINALIGMVEGWYDWNNSEITLNWELLGENVHTVRLERIESFDEEFTLVQEFSNLTKMYVDEVLISGTYIYRLSVLDEFDVVLDYVDSKEFYIEAPQHLYHLNAYFNQGTGEVGLDFGFNEYRVHRYEIYKSDDGGLSWVEVISNNVEYSVDDYVIHYTQYSELIEGTYVYKMIGYDVDDNVVGEVLSWNEVSVRYNNLNLDEPTEIYYVGSNINIYNEEVSIWWDTQGPYDSHLIEKSTDLINWVYVDTVDRVITYYYYVEETDGEYYFRVSAVDSNDLVVDSNITENSLRVKEDAQIGYFGVWFDIWNQEVYLNWDIIDDNLAIVRVERKLVGDVDFVLVGNYGPLKRVLFETDLPDGEYVYKLTLLDEFGNILDELISYEVLVEEYID